jgi:hypothetical protein
LGINKVSSIFEKQKFDEVMKAFETIKTNMPFLISLTAEEKNALPKFGDRSISFVKKAYEFALANPEILPKNFSVEEMGKDVALYEQLYSVIQVNAVLTEKFYDTYFEVGAESYSSALTVYQQGKLADKDMGGFGSVMDELGKRFVKKSQTKK